MDAKKLEVLNGGREYLSGVSPSGRGFSPSVTTMRSAQHVVNRWIAETIRKEWAVDRPGVPHSGTPDTRAQLFSQYQVLPKHRKDAERLLLEILADELRFMRGRVQLISDGELLGIRGNALGDEKWLKLPPSEVREIMEGSLHG